MLRFLRLVPVVALAVLASCSTLPFENVPRLSDDPRVMGSEPVGQDRFVAFAMTKNPELGKERWNTLWQAYEEACEAEGVSQSVALVQMLHETGYQKFGGTVQPAQNNFAGLGTVNKNTPGLSFPDVKTGALAHVQHLKAYGSTDPLVTPSVDPRFRYVKRGSAPTMKALTGKWAADPQYGDKLMRIYRQLGGLDQ